MAQREYSNITIEDYLLLNEHSQSAARYEYLDGELRMLAGGSANHSTITTNITGMLYGLLRGGPCQVYNADMQLQLTESRYVYPDVSVTCDPRDEEPEDDRLHYPTLVIEVLSPATETVDRGKKLLYYQAHPTIKEYMLVDSQRILIEIYHREDGRWPCSTYALGADVHLESLGVWLSINDIYERTSLLRKRREDE